MGSRTGSRQPVGTQPFALCSPAACHRAVIRAPDTALSHAARAAMTDSTTSSMLQRLSVILAVTAASYGLPMPVHGAREAGPGPAGQRTIRGWRPNALGGRVASRQHWISQSVEHAAGSFAGRAMDGPGHDTLDRRTSSLR
ncbi:MAG: hypothetical protein NVSMB34_00290 [Variovorax sp.]